MSPLVIHFDRPIESIFAASNMAMWYLEFAIISSYSSSLRFSVSFFESFNPFISPAKIHPAIAKGPARGPLPASSIPHITKLTPVYFYRLRAHCQNGTASIVIPFCSLTSSLPTVTVFSSLIPSSAAFLNSFEVSLS